MIETNDLFSDSDQYATEKHNCSSDAVCNNTKVSHNYTCKPGYSGDGQTCKGRLGFLFTTSQKSVSY